MQYLKKCHKTRKRIFLPLLGAGASGHSSSEELGYLLRRRSPNCECQRSSLDPYGIYCKIDTDDTDRYRKIWNSERKSLYCNQGTSVSSGSIQSIRGCQYKVPHFSGSHKGYLAATAANLFETLNPWQETSCITVGWTNTVDASLLLV